MSIEKLISTLGSHGIEYKINMPSAPLSTFRIGGECAVGIFPGNKEEMIASVRAAVDHGVRYTVLGRGSNVLFPDSRYDGALIFTSRMAQIRPESETIYAEAGVGLGALTGCAAENGLSGLEFAYGIPGSLGGAVFMNAGAYGGEMKDVTLYSDYYDPAADRVGRFSGDEQEFSYRKSVYCRRDDLVILGAAISLKRGNESDIRALMSENARKRREKQPSEPSAGSTFKRPENRFAAQMIDECGLKGYTLGGAAVSEKHAGFIVNKGGATSKDVKELMEYVADRVFERFGIRLEKEIRFID